MTLKLTKRSRTETHSSTASGEASEGPPHKKKKRSRGSRDSSSQLGTPSPVSSPHRGVNSEPVFQQDCIRFARPPRIDFRVLGVNQRPPWELSRAPSWNMRVPASVSSTERLMWKKGGDRGTTTTTNVNQTAAVVTGKLKYRTDQRPHRVARSCSLFSII